MYHAVSTFTLLKLIFFTKTEVNRLSNESSELKSLVSSLSDKLSSITLAVQNISKNQKIPNTPNTSRTTPAQIDSFCDPQQGVSSESRIPDHPSMIQSPRFPSNRDADRNLNVVVFRITESKSGTPRQQRWKHDVTNVTDLFDRSPCSIPRSSIRDCRRLGKYSSTYTRPRPILVSFNSCNIVMDILKQKSTFSPFVVKPDLPYEKRLTDQTLLKKRWQLINFGTNKAQIRIKRNSIFVDNMSIGYAKESLFIPTNNDNSSTSCNVPTMVSSNNPIDIPADSSPELPSGQVSED